jgi:hypothetical protein
MGIIGVNQRTSYIGERCFPGGWYEGSVRKRFVPGLGFPLLGEAIHGVTAKEYLYKISAFT